MGEKHLGMRVFGWFCLIIGYGLALLLIRGIFIGITRGFNADRSQAFWIALGYLLFLGLGVYLFTVGRRVLSMANGGHRQAARFGWGRIVVGTTLLYSYAVNYFHLIPVRNVTRLKPTSETQAITAKVTTILIAVGCLALIFSGLWKGIRPQRASAIKLR